VTVLDTNLPRLRYLDEVLPRNCHTVYSTPLAIRDLLPSADLLVGAVLIPGAAAPKLVRREDLKRMNPGSVIVDVAVDQGGCVETIKPTTHEKPTYIVDGVVHYGVANMPGAVPRTSTLALTNATLAYARTLARLGWQEACKADRALALGLNIVGGKVVYPGVADAFGMKLHSLDSVL
jgi:alanine dehydrogenase